MQAALSNECDDTQLGIIPRIRGATGDLVVLSGVAHPASMVPLRFLLRKDTSERCPPKLLDQVRAVIRVKHFSLSTERAYVGWIRRFILFHHKQHPKDMAETEIREFISHLAVNARISASTQTVALSALLFLYRDVWK